MRTQLLRNTDGYHWFFFHEYCFACTLMETDPYGQEVIIFTLEELRLHTQRPEYTWDQFLSSMTQVKQVDIPTETAAYLKGRLDARDKILNTFAELTMKTVGRAADVEIQKALGNLEQVSEEIQFGAHIRLLREHTETLRQIIHEQGGLH